MTALDRIKKISKERGYSLTQVNAKAHLGTNTIYSWKHKEPSYNNLKAVATVLGISVRYLQGETDDPTPIENNEKKTVDIADDDVIMTYEGRPIPKEDLEYIKRILDGGK